MNKAVFFDRDGTLNVDVHYLHDPADFVWTEGAVSAIRYCHSQGYKAVVISNQSGVARGFFPESDVIRLHNWMQADLARQGTFLDAFYYCPHHPTGKVAAYAIACDCRKPLPGLVNRACRELHIDKAQSFFVGDKESDMACAQNAGVTGIPYAGGDLLLTVMRAIGQENIPR